jgi:plasmid stability protein
MIKRSGTGAAPVQVRQCSEASGSEGITGSTERMAKVMISLPDDLLTRLDAQAAEHGSTRSATIRDLAEAALGERERSLAERMGELDGYATRHGGAVSAVLKAGRPT